MRINNLSIGNMAVSIAVAVALLTGCDHKPSDTTIPAKPASEQNASSVQSDIVKVGNADIQYFSQGEGAAVVLLPGGSLDVGYMEGLASALAKAGYRAVRINFRGAGKSTGPEDGITLHTLAGDVAGVIEALNLGPANVAGHAFGNRVARMLDADRPELVRSVILFAAGGKVAPAPAADQALKIIFTPGSPEAEVLEAMKYMVGDPADVQKVWQIIKPCRAPRAAGIEYKAGEATPLKDWWAPLGKTKYLVVQGADDQAALPENGVLLKKELGERLTLVEIPKAGHLVLVEQPEKVAEEVVSFLHQR
ncbi:MAG TPA: alpha/beta hydrolase [Pirellulales bacterium]|nr:alpha/beta hydrolase [Pirellulales bacterium]